MIYGVDVSSWQVDEFPLTVDGHPVDFAIIKATQGVDYVNPKMAKQTEWARKNGLVVGFYHFVEGRGSIAQQVDHFLGALPLQRGDTLWLDWEVGGVTTAQKDEFIDAVKAQYPEVRVGLYCSAHFWKNVDTSGHSGDALWIAHHDVTPGEPDIQDDWVIHQYSASSGLDRNAALFADRQAMRYWAAGVRVPLEGPVLALLREIRAAQAVEAVRAEARYDALKEELVRLRTAMPTPGSIADEIARRLRP